jgi:hypothetical protein
MNGKPSHTLVARFAANAVEKRENHATGSTPSAPRISVSWPT